VSFDTNFKKWIFCPEPKSRATIRLLCFPYAGSGPTIFRQWPKYLPEEVEMWGIRLPGRESRLGEPAYSSLDPLVTAVSEALWPYLDHPFVIFGHSLGALVGYELAQHCKKQNGPQPLHLFMSGHRAPHCPPLHPPVHDTDNETFLNRIRTLGGTHKQFFAVQDLVQLMLPTLRADFAVWENYKYKKNSTLDIPITAFGGKADIEVQQSDIVAWQEHTNSNFTYHIYPGKHFYFQSNPEPLLIEITKAVKIYL
jgi:medium-chain acyl-[acyl-carrier-protein] hydrolase